MGLEWKVGGRTLVLVEELRAVAGAPAVSKRLCFSPLGDEPWEPVRLLLFLLRCREVLGEPSVKPEVGRATDGRWDEIQSCGVHGFGSDNGERMEFPGALFLGLLLFLFLGKDLIGPR